jgi:hypothetical protein
MPTASGVYQLASECQVLEPGQQCVAKLPGRFRSQVIVDRDAGRVTVNP